MKITNRLIFLLLSVASLILTACGGSSGESAPAIPAPATPTGLSATAKDGYVLLDAAVASDVTGVNIYWSTASGVTPASGNKIIVGSSPQAHTGLSNGTPYYYVVTAVNAGGESAATAQVSATPLPVSAAADPLYPDQWHLENTGQAGAGSIGITGEDLNVVPVWTGVSIPGTAILGAGIRIAVVDDGLEIAHEDLASNMAANELSINYVTGSNDPTNDAADTSSGHGTSVAGIIAARDWNGLGVRGVAPRAKLVGYNLLQNSTSSNEADAMTRNAADVSISSNSWGATDGTGELEASSSLWKTAINTGLVSGRGGKGTIYTWAAGNGRGGSAACSTCIDNSNYDGRANYRGVIAVAAVNDKGLQSIYSESGANLWVSAPGGEYCSTHTITTTDRTGNTGVNLDATTGDYVNKSYTRCMNGTSSATPGVAGVVALMLEARPALTWRDVKVILAQESRKNDLIGGGWFTNGGGRMFSHKYGFGVVNASAAVARAKIWPLITGAELVQTPAVVTPNIDIPDATSVGSVVTPGVSRTSTINVASSSITKIEFVEIIFSAANHTYAGDLEVILTSPAGTVSRLAEAHRCMTNPCASSYDGWIFGSSAHLDESPVGDWTLTVTDKGAGDTGTFQSWGLKLYGS